MNMPFNEAIQVLLTVADVRQQQWERLAEGVPIDEIVEEMHEVAGNLLDDPDDTEASNLAAMIWTAIDTVQNSTVIDFLDHTEALLCELIQDAQGICEEASGDEIVVPEDAAPELDDARGHIRDAIEILRDLAKQSEEDAVNAEREAVLRAGDVVYGTEDGDRLGRRKRSSELCGND